MTVETPQPVWVYECTLNLTEPRFELPTGGAVFHVLALNRPEAVARLDEIGVSEAALRTVRQIDPWPVMGEFNRANLPWSGIGLVIAWPLSRDIITPDCRGRAPILWWASGEQDHRVVGHWNRVDGEWRVVRS